MKMTRSTSTANKTGVVVLTADPSFEEQARATFGASRQVELRIVSGTAAGAGPALNVDGVTVVIVDLDDSREEEMQALEQLMSRIGSWPPVVVVTQSFDAEAARRLI